MYMNYNLKNPHVSVSRDFDGTTREEGWTIKNLTKSDFELEELVSTLYTVNKFKKKYPNDEFVSAFDEIVRDEICRMFGGSLPDDLD